MSGVSLIDRVAAVEAIKAEFGGRAFQPGTVDCAVMTRRLLENFGHFVPEVGPYSTERGGRQKLKRAGYASISALLDTILEPIAPARMIIGDIAVLEGEGGEALCICAGRKFIGFHQGYDVLVNKMDCLFSRAWRS
jgi:hypothetical protein